MLAQLMGILPKKNYLWGDRNMLLLCLRILWYGVIMFWGIERSTMAPTKYLTMKNNKQNLSWEHGCET
jgi:hypothetical protein